MKNKFRTSLEALRKRRKLLWVLREWDCISIWDAKKKALNDPELHLQLRMCGIKF